MGGPQAASGSLQTRTMPRSSAAGAPGPGLLGQPAGTHAPAKPRRGPEDWWTGAVLALILGVALTLRLYGFNWDSSSMIHPDERAVSGWINRLAFPHNPLNLFNSRGSWNPGWDPVAKVHDSSGFNYGSLPLYLIYFFSNLLNWLGGIFPWWSDWKGATQDPQRILAGRVLSAFADTVTVFLVYRIGTRLAGTRTGLYAAALATFTVLSIQLSHFTTVDIILTTFCTGAVLSSIDLFTHGRRRDYIFCAIWLAAAVATKASAVPLVSVVVAAHVWRQIRVDDLGGWRTFAMPALSLVAGMIALFIFQPFTFLDWSTFWTGVQYQSDLARGTQTQFYTLKWAGTAPIIYPLQQLTYFSLGIPLALIAFAGAILEGVRLFTAKRNAGALVSCFVVVYFIAAGTLYMKYLRYMEPIVPSLCVLGAVFIAALVRGRVWLGGIWARAVGLGLGAAVLVLTACYGLAYEHIYSQPLTRIEATCWMFAHVPAGARIVQDGIDETLPVDGGLCPTPQPVYNIEPSLATYDDESLFKVQTMAATLSQADWYIITSRRSMDTFLPQPKKYPYTSRLYRLLFDPSHPLGFTIEYHSNVVPSLGPWSLDESGANQNFNEYDHPPVWIFKNTGRLSSAVLVQKLTAGGALAPPAISAVPPRSLMLSPADIAIDQHGPSYGEMFPPGSFAMQHPIIAWLIMLEALGLL
ncbi:MAG: ArnT family glycosyltransferase, partial [Chloroflexota bacterium]